MEDLCTFWCTQPLTDPSNVPWAALVGGVHCDVCDLDMRRTTGDICRNNRRKRYTHRRGEMSYTHHILMCLIVNISQASGLATRLTEDLISDVLRLQWYDVSLCLGHRLLAMFKSNIPEVCLDHSRSDLGHSDGGVDEVQSDGLCESIHSELGSVVKRPTGIGVYARTADR